MEWESPPSILVTRNHNWSQRLGTGTGCVKGRYQHPKYALPKVSCIVLLSDKSQGVIVLLVVGLSMVQDKSSSVRRSFILSSKNLTVLTSIPKNNIQEYVLRINSYSQILKANKKIFLEFLKYCPSSHGLNKLVIKAKMHVNTYIVLKISFVV